MASQKPWGDPWRLLLKFFTRNRVYSPSKVDIVFDYYTDNKTFSIKQTKQLIWTAGKGKSLHTWNDSQEMPQGDDWKNFSKNNLKADLIGWFNESVERDAPRLHVITKKRTLAICKNAFWRINQQRRLDRILIPWCLWYMYFLLFFLPKKN